ncbi:hypothetical protein GQ53DRAFT_286984 [Thozetella sp. PMI_491]|nr:hypothetical protein GQ53DRAFT_286984 [Thozetella sp. PMI_491]
MPDLNSVPASPHVLARRPSSQQMPPPPVPSSPSLNILPSNQSAVNQAGPSSSLPSPHFPPASTMPGAPLTDTAVISGPGPIRHPRPMTAAELHLQLEKEQEAVVNRLSRELSILRAAQNASVVSNTSSTSASGTESAHLAEPHHASFSHPRSRHHRTPSNTSTRSFNANAGSVSATSLVGISSPAPVRPGNPAASLSLSRQNSTSRRSRAGSPTPASHSQTQTPSSSLPQSFTMAEINTSGYFPHHRTPQAPGQQSVHIPAATPGSAASELSPGLLPATSRYEETAFYRSELDSVKRENEALKRRVRELERMVRERRASDASRASQPSVRPRSESVSTAASVSVAASVTGAGGASIAAQREGREGREGRDRTRVVSMLSVAGSVGVGVPEDEVRVGESAASAGLAGQENHGSQPAQA